MSKPQTLKIDDVEYVRADSLQPAPVGDWKIVILQRGWVFVGKLTKDNQQMKLENAYCVRRWGTTQGLGELASKGPLKDTQLEKTPTVEFHELTVIATIACTSENWNKY